jgi:hypothetical protein
MKRTLALVGWIAAASAQAAVMNLSSANVSRTGMELDAIHIGAATYHRADLTQLTLQTYAGGNPSAFLVLDTGLAANDPFTLSAAGRRALLETDWNFATGIINPTDVSFTSALFNAPVINVPGPDIFFFEIEGTPGATPNPADFRINGFTLNVAGSQYNTGLGFSTPNADVLKVRNAGDTADLTPTSLATALSNPLRINSVNIAQVVFGLGLDLSDFGVPAGGSITQIEWKAGSTTYVDPVLIVGVAVPEPSAAVLLTLGGGMLLRCRRR